MIHAPEFIAWFSITEKLANRLRIKGDKFFNNRRMIKNLKKKRKCRVDNPSMFYIIAQCSLSFILKCLRNLDNFNGQTVNVVYDITHYVKYNHSRQLLKMTNIFISSHYIYFITICNNYHNYYNRILHFNSRTNHSNIFIYRMFYAFYPKQTCVHKKKNV